MNVEQRQAAADPQTKSPDLGCESFCFRLFYLSDPDIPDPSRNVSEVNGDFGQNRKFFILLLLTPSFSGI